jgi:hypothetical protein
MSLDSVRMRCFVLDQSHSHATHFGCCAFSADSSITYGRLIGVGGRVTRFSSARLPAPPIILPLARTIAAILVLFYVNPFFSHFL